MSDTLSAAYGLGVSVGFAHRYSATGPEARDPASRALDEASIHANILGYISESQQLGALARVLGGVRNYSPDEQAAVLQTTTGQVSTLRDSLARQLKSRPDRYRQAFQLGSALALAEQETMTAAPSAETVDANLQSAAQQARLLGLDTIPLQNLISKIATGGSLVDAANAIRFVRLQYDALLESHP